VQGFCDDRENVHILRPMREFLESEISAYISLHKLETVLLPKLASVSPDTNSIDNLTESLLQSLQSEFPSTVNTVFRTGDKLQMNESLTQSKLKCLQCLAPYSMELDETIFTHLQSGMDSLCYGCRLTMRDKEDFNSFLFQKEFQS
jgi:cytoplasmic tRNA 2-thiolation protein 2